MSTEVFDPSVVDLPQIKLAGKTYTLLEQNKKTSAKLDKAQKALKKVSEDDTDQVIKHLGGMLEIMLTDSEGLTTALKAEWDSGVLTVGTIYRSVAWIQNKQEELSAAGEV